MVGIAATFATSELPTDGGSCERARARFLLAPPCFSEDCSTINADSGERGRLVQRDILVEMSC